MSIESQSIFFFLLICVGFLVPIGGLYFLVEYRRRSQRLPLLASFENLSERFEARKREYEELKAQLADLGEKLIQRDMAASEADEWTKRKQAAEEDVRQLEPSLRECDRVQQDLRRANESLQKVSGELAEKQVQVNALTRELASVDVMKASTEEQVRINTNIKDQLDARIAEEREALNKVAKDTGLARCEHEDLQSKVTNLEKELQTKSEKLVQIDSRREAVARELESIKSEITSLNAVKKVIEGSFEQTAAQQERDEALALGNLLEIPSCLRGLEHENGQWSEMEALESLSDHLKQLGLQFSRRILNAFHTNLKISDVCPLVVLAGISGTGKSELPRRYAEALGIHFLQVAVQPRWDSPQDLFGFYNYLERNYRATELAQAMVYMDPWNWPEQAANYKNRLLMVLLDEMNLARVEYYFSEFLSRLETRKSANPNDEFSRRPVEISLELGGKSSSGPQRRVFPSSNILFVGTMNEDESTQSISEKVIDRAPVIRFARPNTLSSVPPRPTQTPTNSFLPENLWKAWHRDYSVLSPAITTDLEGWIATLNKALDGLGRPFGHRLNQAIMAYVANHPEVIHRSHSSAAKKAFADQLEQRIFPKLRGLEMDDDRNIQNANDILKLVREDLEDEELAKAFEQAKDRILFTWMGVKRSEE